MAEVTWDRSPASPESAHARSARRDESRHRRRERLLDRAPMLAVTADIPEASYATLTHQRVPLSDFFAPITKRAATVGFSETAELVNDSLDLAAAPRPGPVHLALASDLAVKECESRKSAPQPLLPLAQEEPRVDRIAARIDGADRPLVVIGLGATPVMAPAIRALIDKLQAPFLVSPKAKGIVSEDHPLFAGVATGMAIDKDILDTIRSADLVLGVGFDPVLKCDKTWFADVNMVAIDSCPMAEGRYQPEQAIGNVESLAMRLADAIRFTVAGGSARTSQANHPPGSSRFDAWPLAVARDRGTAPSTCHRNRHLRCRIAQALDGPVLALVRARHVFHVERPFGNGLRCSGGHRRATREAYNAGPGRSRRRRDAHDAARPRSDPRTETAGDHRSHVG